MNERDLISAKKKKKKKKKIWGVVGIGLTNSRQRLDALAMDEWMGWTTERVKASE
jgi:hypothetical protein